MRYFFVFICFLVNTTQLLSVEDEMFYSTYSTWRASPPAWRTTEVLGQHSHCCQGHVNKDQPRSFQLLFSQNNLNFLTNIAQFLRGKMAGRFFPYAYAMEQKSEDDPKKIFADWYEQFGERQLETAVLVVGNTKAGKSTTIASLLGAQLTQNSVINLADNEKGLYPKVGTDFESQTIHAEIYPRFGRETEYSTKDNDLIFVDCPGLNDNRTPPYKLDAAYDEDMYRMVAHATLECSIKSIKNPRLMVVVAYDELTAGGGKLFADFISNFSSSFKAPVLGSTLWVVTKAREETKKEDILRYVRHKKETISNEKSWKETKLLAADIFLKSSGEIGENERKAMEEFKRLKSEEEVLKSIESNLVVFSPLQKESREELVKRLQDMQAVSQDQFIFNPTSQNKFKDFSENIIFKEIVPTNLKKLRADMKIKSLNEDIQYNEEQLSQERHGYNKQALKEVTQNNITKIRNEIATLAEQSRKLEQDRDYLSKNTDEVCLYNGDFSDEWGIWSWWTVKRFMYLGSPITRHEVSHDKYGKFTDWQLIEENEEGKGYFKATYKGWYFSNSFGKVRMYGIHNQQLHVRGLIKLLKQKQSIVDDSIKELDRKLSVLDADIKNIQYPKVQNLNAKIKEYTEEKLMIERDITSLKKQIHEKKHFYEAIKYMRNILLKKEVKDHRDDEELKSFLKMGEENE